MGEVVALPKISNTRVVRLVDAGDQLVNNTDYVLRLTDAKGELIEMLMPGKVFHTERPREVYFDANHKLVFRSYINEEMPSGFVY